MTPRDIPSPTTTPLAALVGMFATNEGDEALLREIAEAIEAKTAASVRAAIVQELRDVAHGWKASRRVGDASAVQAALALLDSPAAEPAPEPVTLDVAWKAVEAALPEGWLTLTLSKRAKSDIGPYSAAVHDGSEGAMTIQSGLAVGHGSTPEVALQRLAARLAHDGEGTP